MYKTSTDYGRLWELAMSGEQIFCTVDYDWGDGKIMRDGARAKKTEYAVEIGVRGMCYLDARFGEKEIFIAWCAKLRVEFIDPASQQKTTAELAAGEMVEALTEAILRSCSSCAAYVGKECMQDDGVCRVQKWIKLVNKAKGLKS